MTTLLIIGIIQLLSGVALIVGLICLLQATDCSPEEEED
jgi:hypothetical protein